MGDTLSSDQLYGKWSSTLRSEDTRISWACDLVSIHADDPMARCRFISKNDVIQELDNTLNNDRQNEILHGYIMYTCHNPMLHLDLEKMLEDFLVQLR